MKEKSSLPVSELDAHFVVCKICEICESCYHWVKRIRNMQFQSLKRFRLQSGLHRRIYSCLCAADIKKIRTMCVHAECSIGNLNVCVYNTSQKNGHTLSFIMFYIVEQQWRHKNYKLTYGNYMELCGKQESGKYGKEDIEPKKTFWTSQVHRDFTFRNACQKMSQSEQPIYYIKALSCAFPGCASGM